MNKIITIAKKEFLDTFRDKRTVIRMILIPLLAFPLIMNLVTTLQSSQAKKEAAKELKVGYYLNGQSSEMIDSMSLEENYKFIAYEDLEKMTSDVKEKEINLAISYPKNYNTAFASGDTVELAVIMRGAEQEEYARFKTILKKQEERLVNLRLASHDLGPDYIDPLRLKRVDQSEFKEIIGKYAGGMLPYIFMAFCFMGCMLPAIDLFAGEKERGTIETLLTSPVNRMQILLGKMIVVVAFGLLSATVALVGLFLSLNLMGEGDEMKDFMDAVNQILTLELIGTLYVLLIPLAIFFAGVMIPISVYSKSFKEAQSILTPLNIVMILPAMVGFVPGVELDYTTAFIPIVNVVLATKAIIAGNADMVLIAITFVSLIILAGISVLVSLKQFDKESNVLR